MVISKNSNETMLFIKKTTTDQNYASLIKQWEKQITQTDSTFKVFEIADLSTPSLRKEISNVELYKDGKRFVGKVLICQLRGDIFIIQGISIDKYWNKKKSDINEMISNFKIK